MNSKKPLKNESLNAGESLESQLTPGQKETWEIIKQGFIELKLAEEGKVKFRPIQELLDELDDEDMLPAS